jgi:hypothetical protein
MRAEIVTAVLEATLKVVTLKLAVADPAGTVTLAAVVATAVFELVSVTTRPPEGAGPDSVTVPVDETPPGTAGGESETSVGTGELTASRPLTVVVPTLATIDAFLDEATATVATAMSAELALCGTETLAGTVATDGSVL